MWPITSILWPFIVLSPLSMCNGNRDMTTETSFDAEPYPAFHLFEDPDYVDGLPSEDAVTSMDTSNAKFLAMDPSPAEKKRFRLRSVKIPSRGKRMSGLDNSGGNMNDGLLGSYAMPIEEAKRRPQPASMMPQFKFKPTFIGKRHESLIDDGSVLTENVNKKAYSAYMTSMVGKRLLRKFRPTVMGSRGIISRNRGRIGKRMLGRFRPSLMGKRGMRHFRPTMLGKRPSFNAFRPSFMGKRGLFDRYKQKITGHKRPIIKWKPSLVRKANWKASDKKYHPGGMRDKKIPPSAIKKLHPGAMRYKKYYPGPVRDKKIPPSAMRDRRIPPSVMRYKKIPPSAMRYKKIPPSAMQDKRIPPSAMRNKKYHPLAMIEKKLSFAAMLDKGQNKDSSES